MNRLLPAVLCGLGLPLLLCMPAMAQDAAGLHWVGSWGASQQAPDPQTVPEPINLADSTLRQVVRLSIGGDDVRVRFSNAFGTQPLHIVAAHIARPEAGGGIDPKSDTALTFLGASDVTIPAGAEYLSDPVRFRAKPLSDLAITLYYDKAPEGLTLHPLSMATSYLAPGDQVGAAALSDAKPVVHWIQVEDVEVAAPAGAFAVATLGDSITDGYRSTIDGNDRWPDELARRLQANPATRDVGVLNEGISGNHLLTDGLGPNALARFDRDILAPAGIKSVILLEGINDLGGLTRDHPATPAAHAALVARIIAAYQQIVARAHAHGIKVYGATITPDMGSDYYHPDAASEADREAVNAWIRAPGHFDAVIDLDKAVRDPASPEHMRADYNSGDSLHPGPKGYRAMGDAIPLGLFESARRSGMAR